MDNEISSFDIAALDKRLDSFTRDFKLKAVRTGTRRGASLIAKAVIAGANQIDDPATAESIAKNVAIRFASKQFKATGDIGFKVGVRGGAKNYAATDHNRRKGRVGQAYATAGSKENPGGDTWHWRFSEFGTRRQRATPFMRPALTNNIATATSEVVTYLNRWIDKQFP